MIPVQTLWIEGPLTPLAELSLASYYKHGCAPVVWTYDLNQRFPEYVSVQYAEQILSHRLIPDYRFHTGQLALFADRFQWELSYQIGGWVGHLDVTLLRPLSNFAEQPYVFGPHHREAVSTALWKAPQGSMLVDLMRKSAIALPPTHWHAMMEVMSRAIDAAEMRDWVVPSLHNDDATEQPLERMTKPNSVLPKKWRDFFAIHWCGSGRIRHRKIQKNSFLYRLQQELGLI